jgi:hypothetical protein
MAVLTYNAIALPYCDTANYSMETTYDKVGNTDKFTSKFDCDVQCVINPDYIQVLQQFLKPGLNTTFGNMTTPSQIMLAIQDSLSWPRRQLSFLVNGQELIPQPMTTKAGAPQTGTVDAANGPKPKPCIVTEFAGDSFILNYGVTAEYVQFLNPAAGQANFATPPNARTSAVIASRWTESVHYDRLMMATVTRDGTFTIRSDHDKFDLGPMAEMVNPGAPTPAGPDWLRGSFAIVGVPDGFKREVSEYKVSPDGLSLHYNLADKEIWRYPPSPAYEAEGEFTEEGNTNMGIREVEGRIKLHGSKGTSQADLVTAAIGTLSQKMLLGVRGFRIIQPPPLGNPNGIPGSVLLDSGVALVHRAYVTVGIYDNSVEVGIRARRKLTIPGLPAPAFGAATVGPPWFFPFGNAAANIFQQATNDHVARSTPMLPFDPVGLAADPTVITSYRPSYLDYGTNPIGTLLQAAAYYDPSLDTAMSRNTRQLQQGVVPGGAGYTTEP